MSVLGQLTPKLKTSAASWCAAIVSLLGLFVLVSWVFSFDGGTSLLLGHPMKANTAFILIMLGLALWRLDLGHREREFRPIDFVLIGVPLILSLLTIIEYVSGINLHIDDLLVVDSAPTPGGVSRPSLMTASIAFLLSLSLACVRFFRSPHYGSSQVFAMVSFLAAFQGVLRYVGLSYISNSIFYADMAVHTASAFVVLSVGILVAQADHGFMEAFSRRWPGGALAQRLWIAVILIPPALGSVADSGMRWGAFGQDFALFLQIMGGIATLSAIVVLTSQERLKVDKEREAIFLSEQIAKKQAERHRQEAQDLASRLSLIADAVPSLVAYLDREGRYVFVNETCARWFGQAKEWFIGRSVGESIGAHAYEMTKPYFERVLTGESVRFENKFFVVESSAVTHGLESRAHRAYPYKEIYVDTSYVPDLDSEGKVRGVVCFCYDLTREKEVQQQYWHAKEIAEEANRAKSQFLANTSHEIRTPLGVILGFADLALETAQNEEAKNYLQTIQRNALELSKLLGDILDLSKVEAKRLEIENVPFMLNSVLEDIRQTMRKQADRKNIRLEFQSDPFVPACVMSDPIRLRQILVNLVGNAIKFTEQGRVLIRTSMAPQPGGSAKGMLLKFEVEDTGIGISSEHKPKLFKPFSQADNSVTRKYGGSGLGLVLSRQIARALGGDLVLAWSEPGQGSRFDLTIGAHYGGSIGSLIAARSGAAVPKLSLSGMNLLLVDDSTDNQFLVGRYLASTGAKIDFANNGAEAVDMVNHDNYDAILMDIQMPVMDGFKATEMLRRSGFGRPIIALTAHALQDERTRALSSGFTDYLTKPISKKVLLEKLRSQTG